MKRGTSLKQLSSIEAEPVCRVRKLVDIGSAIPYDPWEKRNEFFRLQEGDTKGLLHFLASVGFLEHPQLTKRLDGEGRCWLFTSDKDFKELKY